MNDRKSETARYSKVTRRIWLDAGFRELSAPPPNGRDCWMRLLTAHEQGPIPGLFQAWSAGIAQSLGWSPEGFAEAFAEVFAQGMAKVDEKVGLFFLPNAIKHNEPESPNVVRSWKRHWLELPDSPLKDEAAEVLRDYMRCRGPAWEQAFSEALGEVAASPSSNPTGKAKGRPKPSPKPSVKASPPPSVNQEPEQEQEPEQDPESAPTREASSADAPHPTPSAAKPKPDRRKPKRPIPPDWTPKPRHFEKATERGADCALAAEKFRGHAESVDRRCSDWDRAFDNWLLNEKPQSRTGAQRSFDPFAWAAEEAES